MKNDHSAKAKPGLFQNLNPGVIPTLFVAILPKCPLCLAAYLSALGFVGIPPLQFSFWILPLTLLFSTVTIALFFRQARQTANYYPLLLSLAGLIIILVGKYYLEYNSPVYLGGIILAASAVRMSKTRRLAQCNDCWNSFGRKKDFSFFFSFRTNFGIETAKSIRANSSSFNDRLEIKAIKK